MLIMNMSRSRRDWLRLARAKGPLFSIVPQIAKTERRSATVAVSRGPPRSAAQISGPTARNPNGSLIAVCSMSGLKAMTPIVQVTASRVHISIR
jgi:hypothetical protein